MLTSSFQLQAAHETLSDPEKRSKYDNTASPYSPSFTDSDNDDLTSEFDEPVAMPYFFFERFGYGNQYYFQFHDNRNGSAHYMRNHHEERDRRRQADEAERVKAMAAYRHKKQQEEIARVRRANMKKVEEELKKEEAALREKAERMAKRQQWANINAITRDEMQATCLHSKFWDKNQQRKKFKCGTCGQKRGIVAFKCPLCELLACQVCLNRFAKDRQSQMGS